MKKIISFLFLINTFCAFAQKPKLYMLSVGVKDYADRSLNLKYADKDARDVAALFEKQKDLYDVIWVKPLVNREASRNAIREMFAEFKDRVNPDDLFVFFFSGHGIEDGLVPYDFKREDQYGTMLSKIELEQILKNMHCNTLILLDACHSGSFAKGIGKDVELGQRELKTDEAIRRLVEGFSAVDKMGIVIGSSASNEISFECTECENGYFAQSIIDAFANLEFEDAYGSTSRPDANRNGYISPSELVIYIQEATKYRTAQARKRNSQIEIQKAFAKVQSTTDAPFLSVVGSNMTPRNVPTPPTLIDSDNDGIIDSRDQCPNEYGEFANNGCPKNTTTEDAAEFIENVAGISFTMRTVKSGTFKMGSSDSDASSDETPHTVILSKNFRLAEYEVTIEQFRAFIESTSYKTDAEKEGYSWKYTDKWEKMENINWRHDCQGNTRSYTEYNHPVIHVSWNDAVAYCKWLSEKTGKSYRLPTEAEWEYAAGNGSKHTKYSWGNGSPTKSKGGNVTDETKDPADGRGWSKKFDGYNDGYWYTAPVGQYGANDLGLYDMTGNVWEWCADYCDNADGKLITDTYKDGATNPLCKSGSSRVFRGGSWLGNPTFCRVADRNGYAPANRNYYVGFRVAFFQ